MKIFVHDYAGHPFQVQLSRALAAKGHQVLHAFAGALQTPRGELIRRDNDPESFDIQEVPMNEDYARFKYSFRKRRSMEIAYGHEAARLIGRWQPDVVLSSNTPTETQSPILKAARQAGGQFVFWCQDFYSIAVDKIVKKKLPLIGGFIGNYYRSLERRQLRESDHIVAITEDFKPIMVSEFDAEADRISVIPNWAPLESLPVLPMDNDWSRARNLHETFNFLYTGTLGMKHNPGLLLALAKQFRNDAEVRVIVVSEGLGADWLQAQKEAEGLENLVLMGYQPFEQLSQVLASGNVLVGVLEEDAGVFSVPSKVLTYLCAERPILLAVPEVNLAARIIGENQAGLTVRPSDETGFVAAASRLRHEPDLAEKLGKSARLYAKNTFKIDEIAVKFINIIKTTI